MHELIYSQRADGDLRGLPHNVRVRIVEKLTSTKENPWRFFKSLKDRDEFSLRVGDYRVLAEIDSALITVTHIGKREDVYE
ncbi:MAG TPA: type II toxin-antitoxin system RelE/ParE family toxin [Candidatus Binatia bacterium]|nr:type II toxin-antitoxin system RelE/ParE family toxin [Candidatus Binatia bacterium]